jgi:hypothetical protein
MNPYSLTTIMNRVLAYSQMAMRVIVTETYSKPHVTVRAINAEAVGQIEVVKTGVASAVYSKDKQVNITVIAAGATAFTAYARASDSNDITKLHKNVNPADGVEIKLLQVSIGGAGTFLYTVPLSMLANYTHIVCVNGTGNVTVTADVVMRAE